MRERVPVYNGWRLHQGVWDLAARVPSDPSQDAILETL